MTKLYLRSTLKKGCKNMVIKKPSKLGVVFIILTLTLSVIIFVMSSQNSDESQGTSSGVCDTLLSIFDKNYDSLSEAEKLEKIDGLQFYVRKGAHFSAYGLLGILSFIGLSSIFTKKAYVFSISYCLLFSISDEIHQSFVPGRSCELRDICIDSSGALLGTIFIILVLKLFKRNSKQ